MAYSLGVLFLIVGLVVSVALHEAGHMIPAKLFKTLVPEYFIGFGRRIFSWKKNGTEYGFKWLPLGGYVKILGMFPPAKPNQKIYKLGSRRLTLAQVQTLTPEEFEQVRPTLAQEAREGSSEEIPAGQEHRAFYRLKVWQKLVVMAGGIFMNLVLCVVLTFSAMMGIGVERPTTTLSDVPRCVDSSIKLFEGQGADTNKPGTSPSSCTVGPAYAAGIRAGDTLKQWNGTPVKTWDEVRAAVGKTPVHNGKAQTVPVVIERNGTQKTFNLTPLVLHDGKTLAGFTTQMQRQSASFTQTVGVINQMFTGTLAVVVKLPVEVYNVTYSLFTGAPRDPQGVLSIVGAGRIAGEVASAEPAHAVVEPTFADRFASLLMLLASLNMALAAFNLLPLLPLDGGHIAGAIYEGIKRSFFRMRGRQDPGAVDTAAMMPLAYAVIGLFVVMTVILVAADIIQPITIN